MAPGHADDRSLRVLQCIDTLDGGGAERQLTYLSEGLVRLGFTVDVVYMRDGVHGPRLRGSGATLHPLGLRTRLALVTNLYGIIGERRIGVVQTWLGGRMSFAAGVAAQLARRPWIYGERSVAELDRCVRARALRLIARGGAAAVVANSDAGAARWRAAGGPRVWVVPNGVDLDAIAATPPGERRAVDVADDAELVVYAGRFAPAKNVALLADALAALLRERRRAVALVCGEGEELERFRKRVAGAGVGQRCLTPGYRRDVVALLKTADVCIAPSRLEGRPNIVLEAMAAGCPLVLSDIAQHRECVPPDAALWFPVHSAVHATAALIRALDDKQGAHARARRAQQVVRGQSIEAMARAYAAVYATLSSPSDASRCP